MKTSLAPRKIPAALRIVAEQLPRDLEGNLRQLARRHLLSRVGEGAARWLGALSLLLLVQAAADWFLNLSVAVRAIFLAADIALLGWLAWRDIVRPWQSRLGLSDAALLVQKHFPRLRGALIACVQLTDPRSNSTEGSALLVKGLVRETSEVVRRMDLRVIVSLQKFRRAFFRTAVLVLAIVAAGIWFRPVSGLLLARIVLLPVVLPTRTTVEPVTRDLSVGAGADVELAAFARGLVPRHGRIVITRPDGRTQDVAVHPQSGEVPRFATTLKNVRESFQYQFLLDDGASPRFTVQVLPAPALDVIACEQVWPAYTGRGVEKCDPSSLSLLAGSVLRLRIHSTLPLKEAILQLEGDEPKSLPLKIALDDRQTVTAELPIPREGLTGFSVSLLGANDVRSIDAPGYAIDIVPDEVPRLAVLKPAEESQTITLAAKPEVECEVTEDFGLKSLALCYEIEPPLVQQADGAPPPKGVQRREFDLQKIGFQPGATTTVREIWDLTKQQPAWREGWSIRYWIEAVDNNDVTGPGVTRSYEQRWTVVSPEVKRKELLSQFRENAEAIKDFSDRQSETSDGVRGLLDPEQKP